MTSNAMVPARRRRRRSALNQKQEADIRPRITGYDQRLKDLDAMGIDIQLVDAAAATVLLHGAARHRGRGRAHRQ